MKIRDLERYGSMRTAILICLCFLLTSTAYLEWTYHVISMLPPVKADFIILAAGYGFQAAGIAVSACLLRRKKEEILYITLLLHLICMLPASHSNSAGLSLASGFVMNFLCGVICGYYLYQLSLAVSSEKRGCTLGIGYSVSIIVSWLLSLIRKQVDPGHMGMFAVCFFLSAAIICLAENERRAFRNAGGSLPEPMPLRTLSENKSFRKDLLAVSMLVLLFSIINSCGFGFPSADLSKGVSVEFSRIFYAAGLLIAGIVNDRDRRYGGILAMTALVVPFIMLVIKGVSVSFLILWALSYFTFGFFTVFRILTFSDMAGEKKLFAVSGFGLLAGRLGDAFGEVITLLLAEHVLILITVLAALFAAAVVLFFVLYQRIWLPQYPGQETEQEKFSRFSAQYELSAREREVLMLILQEKNNQEIAEILSISESTVKFHIHNLLQKTGCRNRVVLLNTYAAGLPR